MDETNRRHSPRQNEDTNIQVLLVPDDSRSSKGHCDPIPVRIGNQSQEGLYIETDLALKPGSNVSIKMVSPDGDHPENAYYMRDGQVVWCKKFHHKISRFGVGIKILRRVVQADVLTSRFSQESKS